MKKIIIAVIGIAIIGVFLLFNSIIKTNASNTIFTKSTDSEIVIDKKAHSQDWKSTWIIVHDANDKNAVKLKLIIKDQNTWNLIQLNKRYFASYERKGSMEKIDNAKIPYELKQISPIGNPDNIPLR
ncbi:MAG: hypothetical protein ACO1OT_12135 [Heyndrickxia sp.]